MSEAWNVIIRRVAGNFRVNDAARYQAMIYGTVPAGGALMRRPRVHGSGAYGVRNGPSWQGKFVHQCAITIAPDGVFESDRSSWRAV